MRALLAVTTALLLAACGAVERQPAVTPTVEDAPPAATATPGPGPAPQPAYVTAASGIPCEARPPLNRALALSVQVMLGGFDGEWGFAFIDIECGVTIAVNPDYVQYPASAGKIVSAVAALRAVQAGVIAFDEVDQAIREMMHFSYDFDADYLESFVTAEEIDRVLADSGASDLSVMNGGWTHAMLTATDLARVWAAILDGTLLEPEYAAYILELARTDEIEVEFQTFPDATFTMPGFAYGQKAGYYISDGTPYDLVGAGYFRPDSGGPGFAAALLVLTENPDLMEPRRRTVFPLLVQHVFAVTGAGDSADAP